MRKSSGGPTGSEHHSSSARDPEDLGCEFLAAPVHSTPDGIVVLDSDYRLVYANPASPERLGYPLDRWLGQDYLALLPEHERQTYQAFLERARSGNPEASTVIVHRPDGSDLEVEVRATVLDVRSKQFFVVASREATEQRRRAEQAVRLTQAAAGLAGSDSTDAVLKAISEYALTGTRALALWMTLDDEDHVAAWVGAAGVPDGFGERLRSAAAAAATCSHFTQALSAQRVVVYADARQLMERELGMASVTDVWR